MEKRKPHCGLSTVRALIAAGKIRTTVSARLGAMAMGLGFDDVVRIITTLTPSDFYKSMTTTNDHRIWQDVYRASTANGPAYIKLTVIEEVVVVSFKEL
jgi:motility quorum-sensing regulator/GCU-specific mRNA interferase toxin